VEERGDAAVPLNGVSVAGVERDESKEEGLSEWRKETPSGGREDRGEHQSGGSGGRAATKGPFAGEAPKHEDGQTAGGVDECKWTRRTARRHGAKEREKPADVDGCGSHGNQERAEAEVHRMTAGEIAYHDEQNANSLAQSNIGPFAPQLDSIEMNRSSTDFLRPQRRQKKNG
jgi:hypothetical protein